MVVSVGFPYGVIEMLNVIKKKDRNKACFETVFHAEI